MDRKDTAVTGPARQAGLGCKRTGFDWRVQAGLDRLGVERSQVAWIVKAGNARNVVERPG